ncbi:MAG: hypothetical protein QOH96_2345 [Blastocatellia bacterium]|nr:hypothetical protein [Blastocatellia bacterium]
MKITRILLFCSVFVAGLVPVFSQDEPRAAWQVTRFDISADTTGSDRNLVLHSTITIKNVGAGAGSTVTLHLSPKAQVTAAHAGDTVLNAKASPEPRGNTQRISLKLPTSVAPAGTVSLTIDYRLAVESNNGLASLSPVGDQFLPLSSWYPAPNTPYSPRGADVAPFHLAVNAPAGEQIVSSGKVAGSVVEQTLFGVPFFLTGNWDVVEGAGDAKGISAFLPKGASADEHKNAERLVAFAQAARSFFSTTLGALPDSQIKLVAVSRGAGFTDGGTLLLDPAVFRREQIDSGTALQVAQAVCKIWIGGITSVRGEGSGTLTEGLTRFLATQAVEKQFGKDAAAAEQRRERESYSSVARRDAPLAVTTLFDDTYFTTVSNKGALVWRLVDHVMGRDPFLSVLRAQMQLGAGADAGLRLASLRAALAEKGGVPVKALLDLSFDRPTELDLQIGLPQQKGAQWSAALRNTGNTDVSVSVVAISESGQRLSVDTTIPAASFGEAMFNSSARVVRVEIDPEKLYPQLDYSNDIAPRSASPGEQFTQANTAFAKQDFAKAENLLRGLLTLAPTLQEAHVLLGRSLLAENKLDDAEKEFNTALHDPLPSAATLGWSNVGLGEIALRRGQSTEAIRRYTAAVMADAEYGSTLAARLGRIKAEAAANAIPRPDSAIQSFIGQADAAIMSGHKSDLEGVIVPGELTVFVKGIVGSQPELWQTRVVRTEMLGAGRAAVDVTINAKQLGKDVTGTAVLIVARMGNSWRLNSIDYFEVR